MTYRTLPSERTSYVAFAIALAWKSRPRCLRSWCARYTISSVKRPSGARSFPPQRRGR